MTSVFLFAALVVIVTGVSSTTVFEAVQHMGLRGSDRQVVDAHFRGNRAGLFVDFSQLLADGDTGPGRDSVELLVDNVTFDQSAVLKVNGSAHADARPVRLVVRGARFESGAMLIIDDLELRGPNASVELSDIVVDMKYGERIQIYHAPRGGNNAASGGSTLEPSVFPPMSGRVLVDPLPYPVKPISNRHTRSTCGSVYIAGVAVFDGARFDLRDSHMQHDRSCPDSINLGKQDVVAAPLSIIPSANLERANASLFAVGPGSAISFANLTISVYEDSRTMPSCVALDGVVTAAMNATIVFCDINGSATFARTTVSSGLDQSFAKVLDVYGALLDVSSGAVVDFVRWHMYTRSTYHSYGVRFDRSAIHVRGLGSSVHMRDFPFTSLSGKSAAFGIQMSGTTLAVEDTGLLQISNGTFHFPRPDDHQFLGMSCSVLVNVSSGGMLAVRHIVIPYVPVFANSIGVVITLGTSGAQVVGQGSAVIVTDIAVSMESSASEVRAISFGTSSVLVSDGGAVSIARLFVNATHQQRSTKGVGLQLPGFDIRNRSCVTISDMNFTVDSHLLPATNPGDARSTCILHRGEVRAVGESVFTVQDLMCRIVSGYAGRGQEWQLRDPVSSAPGITVLDQGSKHVLQNLTFDIDVGSSAYGMMFPGVTTIARGGAVDWRGITIKLQAKSHRFVLSAGHSFTVVDGSSFEMRDVFVDISRGVTPAQTALIPFGQPHRVAGASLWRLANWSIVTPPEAPPNDELFQTLSSIHVEHGATLSFRDMEVSNGYPTSAFLIIREHAKGVLRVTNHSSVELVRIVTTNLTLNTDGSVSRSRVYSSVLQGRVALTDRSTLRIQECAHFGLAYIADPLGPGDIATVWHPPPGAPSTMVLESNDLVLGLGIDDVSGVPNGTDFLPGGAASGVRGYPPPRPTSGPNDTVVPSEDIQLLSSRCTGAYHGRTDLMQQCGADLTVDRHESWCRVGVACDAAASSALRTGDSCRCSCEEVTAATANHVWGAGDVQRGTTCSIASVSSSPPSNRPPVQCPVPGPWAFLRPGGAWQRPRGAGPPGRMSHTHTRSLSTTVALRTATTSASMSSLPEDAPPATTDATPPADDVDTGTTLMTSAPPTTVAAASTSIVMPRTMTTALEPPIATASLSMTESVGVDAASSPKQPSDLLSSEARTVVQASSAVAVVGALIAPTSTASRAPTTAAMLRAAECDAGDDDDDGDREAPDRLVMPLYFNAAGGETAYSAHAGGAIVSAVLVALASAAAVIAVRGGSAAGARWGAILASLVVAFLPPGVTEAAGAAAAYNAVSEPAGCEPDPAVSGSGSNDEATSTETPTAICIAMAVVSLLPLVALVWYLTRSPVAEDLPQRLEEHRECTERGDLSAADADHSRSDAAIVAIAVVVDASRDGARPVSARVVFCEECLAACAIAAAAGVAAEVCAVAPALAVVAIVLAHLGYIVGVRPYESRVDMAFSAANACLELVLAILGVVRVAMPSAEVPGSVGTIVPVLLVGVFVGQPVVAVVELLLRRQREASAPPAKDGSIAVGGGTGGNSSPAVPLLVAPQAMASGARYHLPQRATKEERIGQQPSTATKRSGEGSAAMPRNPLLA